MVIDALEPPVSGVTVTLYFAAPASGVQLMVGTVTVAPSTGVSWCTSSGV